MKTFLNLPTEVLMGEVKLVFLEKFEFMYWENLTLHKNFAFSTAGMLNQFDGSV